jgi:general secretion pathway protein F
VISFRAYTLWLMVAMVLGACACAPAAGAAPAAPLARLLLRVPGISGLLVAMDTARFASTLSILMASGVPLLEALRIAGQVLENLVLREESAQVALQVQEGSSLSRPCRAPGTFRR